MKPLKILVVEDEPEWQNDVKDAIHSFWLPSPEVDVVENGDQALSLLEKNTYALVIIDLSLSSPSGQLDSDLEGLMLLRKIRLHPDHEKCVAVIHTGRDSARVMQKVQEEPGINVYLVKDDFGEEAFVRMLQQSLEKAEELQKFCVLSFTIEEQLSYQFEGDHRWDGPSHQLNLSRERYNKKIAFAGSTVHEHHQLWLDTLPTDKERILKEERYARHRQRWRQYAELEGQDFYQLLFGNLNELHRNWGKAIETVKQEANLLLRFNGPKENLALPFELLDDGRSPLAVVHPMSRQIHRTQVGRNVRPWNEFLQSQRNQPLRVLLLAGAKEALAEIETVAEHIQSFAKAAGMKSPQIERPAASIHQNMEEVLDCLRGEYHWIHYAGHAVFDEDSPEDSYLGVPKDKKKNRQITAGQLFGLLKESPPQFFYFSCCSGAEVGVGSNGGRQLGLLHAAINAGAGAAIGYRWPVKADSAREFAGAFYRALDASPHSLEMAALTARKSIYQGKQSAWDEAWFSPILVVQ